MGPRAIVGRHTPLWRCSSGRRRDSQWRGVGVQVAAAAAITPAVAAAAQGALGPFPKNPTRKLWLPQGMDPDGMHLLKQVSRPVLTLSSQRLSRNVMPGMMGYALNLNTEEAEAAGLL